MQRTPCRCALFLTACCSKHGGSTLSCILVCCLSEGYYIRLPLVEFNCRLGVLSFHGCYVACPCCLGFCDAQKNNLNNNPLYVFYNRTVQSEVSFGLPGDSSGKQSFQLCEATVLQEETKHRPVDIVYLTSKQLL